ncbi:hypothetical protein Cgig2_013704 [Carnegiea gigantea]|uniref:Uncharacterized protein n=1 Tax=Carnegiea gigantea TaxID=171969 RepID=A0A9Q1K7G5_9CARY|nr:hypothetical protein Cgig2_013704 [Carnegiea gigantea]
MILVTTHNLSILDYTAQFMLIRRAKHFRFPSTYGQAGLPLNHSYGKDAGDKWQSQPSPFLYLRNFSPWKVTIIIFWSVRLAPEEISNDLTGFGHNGVTCIGMKTDIPGFRNDNSYACEKSDLQCNSRALLALSIVMAAFADSIFAVILDEAITKLSPDYFWLGGGEVYLKMGIRTSEFIQFVKPFIFSCSTA